MNCLILLNLIAIFAVNNADDKGRIIGGKFAKKPIPYQASLRIGDEMLHFCAGSIIHERFILTAAQCVFEAKKNATLPVFAMVGTNYLYVGGTPYIITSFFWHEEYEKATFKNDIAIMVTKDPIVFNDNVQPISLFIDEIPEESKMIVSGWGVTNLVTGLKYSNNLKVLTEYSIENDRCSKWLENAPKPLYVFPSDICAFRSFQQGICAGDVGGPLVYRGRLAGIASRAVPCAQGMPDIFTRVAAYSKWITEKSKKFLEARS